MNKTDQRRDEVVSFLNDSMDNMNERRERRRKMATPPPVELSQNNELYTTQQLWYCCSIVSFISATIGVFAGAAYCLLM